MATQIMLQRMHMSHNPGGQKRSVTNSTMTPLNWKRLVTGSLLVEFRVQLCRRQAFKAMLEAP